MSNKAQDLARAKRMLNERGQGVPPVSAIEAERKALQDAGFPVEDVPNLDPMGGPDPFLDLDGAMKATEMPSVPAEEPEQEEVEEKPPEPMDIISALPGGPSKDQMSVWKQTYPEVFFIGLTDKEYYVYRYLTHIEWHSQIKNSSLIQDQDALKDAVISRCVLWPKYGPAEMARQKGGLRDLLYEVIMQSSYFLDPSVALGLVQRL